MQVSVVGLGWYAREDYKRLKTMFVDGEQLPDTFEDWLKSAEAIFSKLMGEGHMVVKANIDPDTFLEWCRTRGLELNAKARMDYSNECAANEYRMRHQQ